MDPCYSYSPADGVGCCYAQATLYDSAYEIKRSKSPWTSLETRSPWLYKESALRNTDTDVSLSISSNSSPNTASPKLILSSPASNALTLSPFRSPPNRNTKTITMLSPSTPLQNLFASSPGGFWQPSDCSVSPILHTSSPDNSQSIISMKDSCEGKIQSLVDYHNAQEASGSPEAFESFTLQLSPSSLSSLSSVSSSPASIYSPTKPRVTSSSMSKRSGPLPPCFSVTTVGQLARPGSSPHLTTSLSNAGYTSAAKYSNQMGNSRYLTRSQRPLQSATLPAPTPLIAPRPTHTLGAVPKSRVGRKRAAEEHEPSARDSKRAHIEQSPDPSEGTSQNDTGRTPVPNRTFPLRIPIHPEFPLFYRRFAASSITEEEQHPILAGQKISDASYNTPRDPFDLYTPRFVKGVGATKVGLCPVCCESVARGGESKRLWLSMKFSALNYHMQYAHGISAMTGRPLSPPVAFKTVRRERVGKHEKTQVMQGKCHKCAKWVPVEGIKDVPSKVPEIHWWKHAAICHQGSVIEGECDTYIEDEIYQALCSATAGSCPNGSD
ncbi:hypothetical protein OBBRIDRAFT_358373 [Obba rivulosa]|uniref:Transcription regulator Rua1 C-terminal domain-containing protein n=1 Tax=Obba rivulosa TaxID=1052685 RepID=A0A8E2AQH5_9APHY|nr:hypothetical protein OBBRIDRAFT_358373 [Obba rivulosa]